MDDNSLLMIVLAFVLGYMASGMMKTMCGSQRLVEGSCPVWVEEWFGWAEEWFGWKFCAS